MGNRRRLNAIQKRVAEERGARLAEYLDEKRRAELAAMPLAERRHLWRALDKEVKRG